MTDGDIEGLVVPISYDSEVGHCLVLFRKCPSSFQEGSRPRGKTLKAIRVRGYAERTSDLGAPPLGILAVNPTLAFRKALAISARMLPRALRDARRGRLGCVMRSAAVGCRGRRS